MPVVQTFAYQSVEIWGESEQALDIFSNFAAIKVNNKKVSD